MKLQSLFTILFLMSTVLVFSQKNRTYTTEFEVIYDAVFSLDSTQLDKTTQEEVFLYTGSESGAFMFFNLAKAEEIKAAMVVVKKGNTRSVSDNMSRETHMDAAFYKDLQSQKILTQRFMGDEVYEYEEPKPIEWEILQETDTLMDYRVQKAQTHFAGRDYIAWFTLEIPIPDGPYVFSGLPGLIIDLYDTENHYHFKMKSIDKLAEPKIWSPISHSRKVSKEEFNDRQKRKNTDQVDDIFRTTGENEELIIKIDSKRINAAEYRRILKESGKLKNNPIERLE